MLIDVNWSSASHGKFPTASNLSIGSGLPLGCDFKWVKRQDALDADGASQNEVSLGDVWRRLTTGETKVVDHFVTDDRCYMIVAPAGLFEHAERPCARKIDILERVLLEGDPKGVAIDLGLTASSIASLTKLALASLGIFCTLSHVPLQAVMAAFASRELGHRAQARFSRLEQFGLQFSVISSARPDTAYSPLLSAAEIKVMRLLVEGKTHAEIAAARRTSLRTVANQLAAVFQHLRASGRLRLLRKLTTHAASISMPPSHPGTQNLSIVRAAIS